MSPQHEENSDKTVVAAAYAERLVRFRRATGLTQEAVATRANVHRTEVGKLEQGEREPRLGILTKVCAALGCDPSEFLREMLVWNTKSRTFERPPEIPETPFEIEARVRREAAEAMRRQEFEEEQRAAQDAASSGAILAQQPIKVAFGKRLAELRERRGLTQRELAVRSGMTLVSISGLEQGRHSPKIDTAVKIGYTLEASPNELFGGILPLPGEPEPIA
jgi:transcriptional regulator with XRE-family HTH domain